MLACSKTWDISVSTTVTLFCNPLLPYGIQGTEQQPGPTPGCSACWTQDGGRARGCVCIEGFRLHCQGAKAAEAKTTENLKDCSCEIVVRFGLNLVSLFWHSVHVFFSKNHQDENQSTNAWVTVLYQSQGLVQFPVIVVSCSALISVT